MNEKYLPILGLPHHISRTHPRMSAQSRAQQFAPFAALSGHDEALWETQRQVEKFVEIDDSLKREMDLRLRYILSNISLEPHVRVTYFSPDAKKRGGEIKKYEGRLSKWNESERELVLKDGTHLPISSLLSIWSDILEGWMED